MSDTKPTPGPASLASATVQHRHQRMGWWSLLVFLTLGIVLEGLHGLKADLYLNTQNETRRLMWTLAHAHGTLLSLVHLGFAAAVASGAQFSGSRLRFASVSLQAGGFLLPAGFLLGGIWIHGGDPGVGIILVPVGALFLLASVFLTAVAVSARR